MADSNPLVRSEPVPRLDFKPRAALRPNTKIVYATVDGELETYQNGKRLKWSDRQLTQYRTRYEVDVSEHYRSVELSNTPPPARGGLYKFSVAMTVGYRVVDPVKAVESDIGNGLPFVYGYLLARCPQITVKHAIEDFTAAEADLNRWFSGRHDVGGGIELFSVVARVEPDAQAAVYLKAQVEAKRNNVVKAAQHQVNFDDVKRDNDLELMRKSGVMAIRNVERVALGDRPMTPDELVRIHLERHPDETAEAMAALVAAEKLTYQRGLDREDRDREMVRYLIEHNIIRDVDMDPYRDRYLGGGAPPPAVTASTAWNEPLPQVGVGPIGANAPAPPVPGARAPQSVIPIYVVIDESAAVAEVIDELNAGLRRIYDSLAAEPEIARVVRLAVIGYSDGIAHVVSLHEVSGFTSPPRMSAAGEARYAVAFTHLLNCIPRDAETLKAENPSVRRPQVLFLAGSRPDDEQEWASPYGQLIGQRYAPDIMAFGVGAASPATIGRIATRPEYGFVATGRSPQQAINDFCAFVSAHVLDFGRAVRDGESGPVLRPPHGFATIEGTLVAERPATEQE